MNCLVGYQMGFRNYSQHRKIIMVQPAVTHCRSSVTLVKYRYCCCNVRMPTVQWQVLHCGELCVQWEMRQSSQHGMLTNCLIKYGLMVLLVNDLAGFFISLSIVNAIAQTPRHNSDMYNVSKRRETTTSSVRNLHIKKTSTQP